MRKGKKKGREVGEKETEVFSDQAAEPRHRIYDHVLSTRIMNRYAEIRGTIGREIISVKSEFEGIPLPVNRANCSRYFTMQIAICVIRSREFRSIFDYRTGRDRARVPSIGISSLDRDKITHRVVLTGGK